MREIIKKDVARRAQEEGFVLAHPITGEVIEDIINRESEKIRIPFNFVKMNVGLTDRLIEELGYSDFQSFTYLCFKMTKYGSVDVMCLDKLFTKQVRMRKVRKYIKLGLMKKFKMDILAKSYYFINPYVCNKVNGVWKELSDQFKPFA